MTELISVTIGKESSEHITIFVLRREESENQDYYDGNWLITKIAIVVGAWQGKYRAFLSAVDFLSLRNGLLNLYQTLSGEVKFLPIEPCLDLQFKGDGKGHIEVVGSATDQLGTGNRLEFRSNLDQTFLPSIISQLEVVVKNYPVVGIEARSSI